MYDAWEGGQGPLCAFLSCHLRCIMNLRRGLKINIFEVLFWGRGHIKEDSVYALDIVDNSGSHGRKKLF